MCKIVSYLVYSLDGVVQDPQNTNVISTTASPPLIVSATSPLI